MAFMKPMPSPATMRAQMNMSELTEPHIIAAPTKEKAAPMAVPRLRPILSATQPPMKQPKIAPFAVSHHSSKTANQSSVVIRSPGMNRLTEIVCSCETALLCCICDFAVHTKACHSNESWGARDRAKYTLIVAFIDQGD